MLRSTRRIKDRENLSDRAFETHEELKEISREALKMALFAEAIGARRTAGQLRSAAQMTITVQKFYQAVLREGPQDRRK